jgi:Ankyrin repeat
LVKSNVPKYLFLKYAATHWCLHYVEQDDNTVNEFRKDARTLCNLASPHGQWWGDHFCLQIYWREDEWTDLILACYAGLFSVDINAQTRKSGTGLQVAASEGHEKIVELLLNNGADVNVRGPSRHRATIRIRT